MATPSWSRPQGFRDAAWLDTGRRARIVTPCVSSSVSGAWIRPPGTDGHHRRSEGRTEAWTSRRRSISARPPSGRGACDAHDKTMEHRRVIRRRRSRRVPRVRGVASEGADERVHRYSGSGPSWQRSFSARSSRRRCRRKTSRHQQCGLEVCLRDRRVHNRAMITPTVNPDGSSGRSRAAKVQNTFAGREPAGRSRGGGMPDCKDVPWAGIVT